MFARLQGSMCLCDVVCRTYKVVFNGNAFECTHVFVARMQFMREHAFKGCILIRTRIRSQGNSFGHTRVCAYLDVCTYADVLLRAVLFTILECVFFWGMRCLSRFATEHGLK